MAKSQFLNKQLAYDLPKHEDDHYFLVSIFTQWKNAPQQQAMIQADRALVFAYQKNRLGHQELLEAAAMARSLDKLEAAEKLYKRAHALVPHDLEAKMGLEVVAKLRSGELTKQQLRKQLEKAAHRQGVALNKSMAGFASPREIWWNWLKQPIKGPRLQVRLPTIPNCVQTFSNNAGIWNALRNKKSNRVSKRF